MEVILVRNISRRLFPTAAQLYKTAISPPANLKNHPSLTRTPAQFLVSRLELRLFSQKKNADLATVEFDHVKEAMVRNEVMIIDVREPDEIKELGKIPNSINIPLGSISSTLGLSDKDFQKTFGRAKPKEDTEIIFYCMIGKRSGKAQQSALSLGFKNAKNYLGSWTDWAEKTK